MGDEKKKEEMNRGEDRSDKKKKKKCSVSKLYMAGMPAGEDKEDREEALFLGINLVNTQLEKIYEKLSIPFSRRPVLVFKVAPASEALTCLQLQ